VGGRDIPPPGDARGDNGKKARGVTDIRQVAGAALAFLLCYKVYLLALNLCG